jgi:dihydroneopterin aldolase
MADIGIHPHEIGRRQRLIITATIESELPDDDQIGAAFDYSVVPSIVETVCREHIGLIETFAHRVAEGCLGHPRALRAQIRVEKPDALAAGIAWVEVSLEPPADLGLRR